MRKLLIIFSISLLASGGIFAQSDGVTGYWLTQDGDSQVEIFRIPGNKFSGKIVWLKEPLEADGQVKRDKNNPDNSLKTRTTLGLELLNDFTYNDSKKEWEKGTIYDPKSGKTYSCYMWLDGSNTLKLKGFVMGMRFLGREATWTREKELRK
jgi:uncharacterized protein (DUF2147 family)